MKGRDYICPQRLFWGVVKQLCLIVVTALLWSMSAHAVVYPWLDPPNTRLYLLDDHKVDMALRVAAINQATSETPITIITYYHSIDDEFGMPMLWALRAAAERGVPITILKSRVPNYLFDPKSVAQELLADSRLPRPAEFLEIGATSNLGTPLNLTDSTHEKIMLIGKHVAFFGGRNQDGDHKNMDLAFMMRATNPQQVSFLNQLHDASQNILSLVRRVCGVMKPRPLLRAELLERKREQIQLDSEQRMREFQEGVQFLYEPYNAEASPQIHYTNEFRPQRIRLVTNDLLSYVLTRIYGRSMYRRLTIPDDILDIAHEIISQNTMDDIYLVTMSVLMHPRFKEALTQELMRGVPLRLFSNNRAAAHKYIFRGLTYIESLRDMIDFLSLGRSNFLLHVLRPGLEHDYLHMKLLLKGSRVLAGSHNYNLPSSVANSEIAADIDDERLANRLRMLIEQKLKHFENLSCEQALLDHKATKWWERFLSRKLRVFY